MVAILQLRLLMATFSSGLYYIDPNQGSPKDAVQVFCKIDKKETCVIPKPGMADKGVHFEEPLTASSWFSDEAQDGFQVGLHGPVL